MTTENQSPDAVLSQIVGKSPLETWSGPGLRWVIKWVLLTTAAIPAALLLMAPVAAALLWLNNLGARMGVLGLPSDALWEPVGFLLSFAITLGSAQWTMIRSYLPRPRIWYLATAGGILAAGIPIGVGIVLFSDFNVHPIWGQVGMTLVVGCLIGGAQWLVLRRHIQNAYWIVPIDLAGASSILLAGKSITSLLELFVILFLPGVITGLGLWSLLRRLQVVDLEPQVIVKSPGINVRRLKPVVRIGLGLAALVPLFFLCSWIYAASQLALAKNEGVYPTVEEAVIAKNSQGWGGAEVVKLENVRASVNRHDGSQPHVWFGGATVILDRVPRGWDRTQYTSGSYYLHVKDGWVLVPEGAFPEFIGWVMELYEMEGVDEWAP